MEKIYESPQIKVLGGTNEQASGFTGVNNCENGNNATVLCSNGNSNVGVYGCASGLNNVAGLCVSGRNNTGSGCSKGQKF